MSNFPSFDAPTPANNDFKVTGHEGTGDEADEERARFESSFPDIGGEASAIEVSSVRIRSFGVLPHALAFPRSLLTRQYLYAV